MSIGLQFHLSIYLFIYLSIYLSLQSQEQSEDSLLGLDLQWDIPDFANIG